MSYVFTAKGAKGFASGAAKKACEVAGLAYNPALVVQHEGKWGFWSLDGVPCGEPVVETADVAPVAQGVVEVRPLESTQPTMVETQPEEDGEPEAPVAAAGMFGALAAQLGAVAEKPVADVVAPVAHKGYKIEKNREERNGIKRPSAGGLCRAVWDWCDSVNSATGTPPVAAAVREQAETTGWNTTNAMIEFYQWRKFNGITGRSAKPAPELVQKAQEAGAAQAATDAPVAETAGE